MFTLFIVCVAKVLIFRFTPKCLFSFYDVFDNLNIFLLLSDNCVDICQKS